jgi:hypothetical protein
MNWFTTSSTTTTSDPNTSAQNVDSWISNTIYPGLSTQGEGIDLRQEMRWLLYGNPPFRTPKGHWVIYRRYDRCRPSSNFNKYTREGVHGPAYEYTDTLLRTRRLPMDAKGNPLTSLKAGYDEGDRYVYYFEYTINPKLGDHIIELSWANHSLTPNINTVGMIDRYLVKRVHDYRLENGNIQYWIVSSEYDEVSY